MVSQIKGYVEVNVLNYTVRQKKVIFCPHVLMVIFPFLGGKNDGK